MLHRIINSLLIGCSLLVCLAGPAGTNLAVWAVRGEVPNQTPEPSTVARPLPFMPGEVLTYDVGFSKLIFSGSIGQLKLTVRNGPVTGAKHSDTTAESGTETAVAGINNNRHQLSKPAGNIAQATGPDRAGTPLACIEFSAEVSSKGFFTKLFGIKVEDSYGAIVSSDDFGLLRSWKELDQGGLHRHDESRIDRQSGIVSYSEFDRKNPKAAKVKTGSSPKWVLDMLSAVYFIRTQDLKEGKPITLPITDVGQIYMIDAIPGKHEEIQVDAGKFKAIQLELKIFDGKYIRRSGQLFIWISDDSRRLPLRAKLKSSGTTVNITLSHQQHLS